MTTPQRPVDDLAARRKRATRTALVFGVVAVLIYLAFIASGVVAK